MWDLPASKSWGLRLSCWTWVLVVMCWEGLWSFERDQAHRMHLGFTSSWVKTDPVLVQNGFLLVWILERWILSKTQRAIWHLFLITFWLWGFSLSDTGRKFCFFFQLLENKPLECLVLKDTCFWCCSRSNSSSLPAFGRGSLLIRNLLKVHWTQMGDHHVPSFHSNALHTG